MAGEEQARGEWWDAKTVDQSCVAMGLWGCYSDWALILNDMEGFEGLVENSSHDLSMPAA